MLSGKTPVLPKSGSGTSLDGSRQKSETAESTSKTVTPTEQ